MCCRRALLVRRAETNDRLAADERGSIGITICRINSRSNCGTVVTINVGDNLPTVRLEAFDRIVGKPAADFTVNRNIVVIVERDQLAELQGTRQRTSLVGNTLHQATVAQKYPGLMVHNVETGLIELRGQHFFGQRHANSIRNALPQRTGSRFDRQVRLVLRVTCGAIAQLTKISNLIHRQVVAGQVQQAIQQHRAMTVGQDETIAVGPMRIAWIVLEVIVPQHFGNIRHTHWRAGVTRICGLYRVH